MEEMGDKDVAKLSSMIYGSTIYDDFKNKRSNKLSELINNMEESISDLPPNKKIGGEMTKEEFLDVIDQIKQSDTLMRMEIKDFTDANEGSLSNRKTDFRAMTLVDPENKVKPVIVFRGTAGDSQWDDNLAAIFSSQTPSQKEAAAYVINSGLDHVTLAGHSKGGNMAASCAYLLPQGLIDKVYSFDGQGASHNFLSQITTSQQKFAKNIIYNINEYRDPVSQLLIKTGFSKNSIYFDSGVDYYNADLQDKNFNMKLYLFHVHKPNYYLKPGVQRTNRTFVPSRLAHTISMMNEIDALPEYMKRKVAQQLSGLIYEKGVPLGDSTRWDEDYWDCVLEAEEVYSKVNKSREDALCKKLSELFHVDFSIYKLDQKDSSFVVEGAILMCPYSSNIGDLKNIENHGNLIQKKAVASKKDNIAGKNIVMENCQCSANAPELLLADSESEGVVLCAPEIFHEWVITDADKALYIDGEKVEAVLKKSVLGCCRGGIITVEYNGQIELSALEKLSLGEKVQNAIEDNKIIQSKPFKFIIRQENDFFKKKFLNNKLETMINRVNLVIDVAETTINGLFHPRKETKKEADGVLNKINAEINGVIRNLEEEKSKFIGDYINNIIK
jgi:hypothetical protein